MDRNHVHPNMLSSAHCSSTRILTLLLLLIYTCTVSASCSEYTSYKTCWPKCEDGMQCTWNLFTNTCSKSSTKCFALQEVLRLTIDQNFGQYSDINTPKHTATVSLSCSSQCQGSECHSDPHCTNPCSVCCPMGHPALCKCGECHCE